MISDEELKQWESDLCEDHRYNKPRSFGRFLRIIKELRKARAINKEFRDVLERMDSKDREEEKRYLLDRIEVRQAVVEAYRKEARAALQKEKEIMGE